jgi:hypothetical protein
MNDEILEEDEEMEVILIKRTINPSKIKAVPINIIEKFMKLDSQTIEWQQKYSSPQSYLPNVNSYDYNCR